MQTGGTKDKGDRVKSADRGFGGRSEGMFEMMSACCGARNATGCFSMMNGMMGLRSSCICSPRAGGAPQKEKNEKVGE